MTAVPPSFDLTGRLAVVTGAARGLGAAFAAGLAAAGADLVLVDRPGVDLGPVAEQVTGFGRAAHRHPFDLADTEVIAGWVDDLRAAHGPLHILVNNAGVARLEHFNEITVAGWRELMRVNVDAVFFCAQRVAEHMIADGVSGRIVNISSKNGLVAEAGLAHYNASKGAVELLTRSLAAELGPHGITANTIAPGMIATPIDGEFPFDRAAFEAAWAQRIPLRGGYGTPADCVGALLLLASDAGRYVTGTHLVVDGGVLADQMPRLRFMPPYRSTLPTAGPPGDRDGT
ncbi:SDR family NAD(P)-dependent oxidoreductase [Micromonospora sagamiensis]|uniref:Gluconate 5-dehydrogenase n=1 Tax=Micromonospora sagamiensis TaxID=47875 RepID=A0A562WH84_9ACTN|nr:SDR family oxidoreductase [Micromonospora sagamiensis]TWJ29371.1 gluconate 5-dehydrogenase [Micromonospora sagamiensis]BCL17601.1 gluconate 5-dehydrogenase [Micromonospora sagamiensis]